MSDQSLSKAEINRWAAKRLRYCRNRLARRLLDEAFYQCLRDSVPQINPINSADPSRLSVPFFPPIQLPSLPSNQILLSPRSPTPPLIKPDSPHSVLTSRIFPDFSPYLFVLSFLPLTSLNYLEEPFPA